MGLNRIDRVKSAFIDSDDKLTNSDRPKTIVLPKRKSQSPTMEMKKLQ